MQLVWFKRDLRIEDHAALSEAIKCGPILPLYILEPELWKQEDMSQRQYKFLTDCLVDLDRALQSIGQRLIIKVGDAVPVIQKIHEVHDIQRIWSHQETWNRWTYFRDKQVKTWVQENAIPWHEPVQNGVIRCLKNRDGWASSWYKEMKKPLLAAPKLLKCIDEKSDTMPSPKTLGLQQDCCAAPQAGGRREGLKILQTFLNVRGERYTKEMSSPVTAFDSCSRLSPHIAFGTLSIREIFQASEKRKDVLSSVTHEEKGKWLSALKSFSGRLRWHCHFIQKLEDDYRIEFENMHASYNQLRENSFNQEYFEAWCKGETGYPMVDSCMRALIATGWLNFRMRAMLMSFASYHLWLHWRKPALHLAKLFTDYEPGIHYSQVQMQSGTTGINSIRIYNPIKQGLDHDPDGDFIRTWIPQLQNMPKNFIHTPWKNPSQLNGYPMPIVDEDIARKAAAEKIYALRKNMGHKEKSRLIVIKHGSRKSPLKRSVRKNKVKNSAQGELPFF